MAREIVGLFAGIGGIERGLHSAGFETTFLCEKDERAKAVLSARFPSVPISDDVQTLESIPKCDLVSAGFPCQDLSQAGLKVGIDGKESGLVEHLFRVLNALTPADRPTWILIENVSYILNLHAGKAMNYLTQSLEELGYAWAYRVIDARAFGIPQRRQRMLLVASKDHDVRDVLFSTNIDVQPIDDSIGEIDESLGYGFYWTEGLRGLGWTPNGIPTLKIGSKIGIPSPPAIWVPSDNFFGTPDVRDAERLQGFPEDWTVCVEGLPNARRGDRWHMVGNAVCVPVSEWIGKQLTNPKKYLVERQKPLKNKRWPRAAWGAKGQRFEMDMSMWPVNNTYKPILEFLRYPLKPLSIKGASGFYNRAKKSKLIRYPDRFLKSLEMYIEKISEEGAVNGN
jgi:DNA (cytosine-5)-methyltransferase 1